jgi:hypothetical protein
MHLQQAVRRVWTNLLPAASFDPTFGFSDFTSSAKISVSLLPVREASTASRGLASPKGFCKHNSNRCRREVPVQAYCTRLPTVLQLPSVLHARSQ